MAFVVPEYKKNNFTCPYCGVLAEQVWETITYKRNEPNDAFTFAYIQNPYEKKEIAISTCNSCHNEHIWIGGEMVIPKVSNVPMPLVDMPEKVKEVYNEARDVFPVSAKASAALLRLALQYLCVELGEKGKNINDDIGELVKKGLPVKIQQALDIVRVIGNNAVHPGVLNLNDNNEIAAYLFKIINLIVDDRIVQPKKIQDLYDSLPQKALEAITERDNNI